MKTLNFNVLGIAGSESKTKIKNALDEIKGVQKICVNVAVGTVEVEFNGPATENEIKNCIIHTGYQIK